MYFENSNNQLFISFIQEKYPDAKISNSGFINFVNPKDEYESLKNGVGVRLLESKTIIHLTGKDVLDFLHRISTNSLKTLPPFNKKTTLFLNEKGRFIDRASLLYLENEFLLVGLLDNDRRLVNWINKYIITEDIKTSDLSDQYTVFEFIGSQTESFLTLILGSEINGIDHECVRRFDVDGFTFHIYRRDDINNPKVILLIERSKAVGFINYMNSINGVFDLQMVGKIAYDHYRIKNKLPAFPEEINDLTNPHEVNLLSEVDFKKGCYIGQEIIARLDTYDKVQKKLVSVKGEFSFNSEEAIILDQSSNEVGTITTSSKLCENFLALGFVSRKILDSGEPIFLSIGNELKKLEIIE